MRSGDWIIIASIAGLIVVAGFFAMAETALTRINRIKAITLAEEGRRGAGLLVRLAEHTERFLNPVLFLVLICHLAAGTLLGLVTERYKATGLIIGLIVEAVVIFVLAEAAPKTWAIQHTERAALLSAPIVSAIASFPPVRLLASGLIGLANVILPGRGLKQGPFVSEEELLATVDVALEDEIIEREERALIHSIIEFGDTVAREVMVPRPDMVAVEGGGMVGDVMEVAIAAGYSRIPVFEQGIDDIVGIIYVKDLMRAEREGVTEMEVRDIVRPAHFVPETKRVHQLMREMQKDKFHMAIVVDE
ncbi:MAG: magnesium and cobalt exporter, family, partial [Acidimicrobiaceae bacterium]|nr:magnesium and cobalt exporter, family [Acidimicrobiaceae bacterium]